MHIKSQWRTQQQDQPANNSDPSDFCWYDKDLGLSGELSSAEKSLRLALRNALKRLPNMAERNCYYNSLKTGEITSEQLGKYLQVVEYLGGKLSDESYLRLYNWTALFPWKSFDSTKVYLWSVDFHPSPTACNFNIYHDVGAILHAEVDHFPFCEYYGVCPSRLPSLFGLGKFMSGFSLDPDHNALKKDFYATLKDDKEFQRIDAFICSHPAANCELFEKFTNKSMIMFFTTRLEFGRNDMNINWRSRTVGKWNAWGELELRQRELVEFIIRNHANGRLALAANNLYDVHYVEYFTGLKPEYIPSWCGNGDNSYNLKDSWIGCETVSDAFVYKPIKDDFLIVPYKQRLWTRHGGIDESHSMYIDLQRALNNFTSFYKSCSNASYSRPDKPLRCPIRDKVSIKHSAHEFQNHDAQKYRRFPGVIFIPYQTSVMTFFEIYRQNIPIFSPSIDLLVDWHCNFHLVQDRIYGSPKRYEDLVENVTGKSIDRSVPDPNTKEASIATASDIRYWLKFSDMYAFPHVIQFTSWENLLELIAHTNLTQVSENMRETNKVERLRIMQAWDRIFTQVAPHRKRGEFQGDKFVFNSL